MKGLLTALAVCLLLSISSAAQSNVDRADAMDLNGPVKTLTVIVTQSSRLDSQAKPKQIAHQRFTFDEKARVVEEVLLDAPGAREYKHVFEYDANGRKVLMKQFTDGMLDSWTKYNYDSKGRLISSQSFDSAGNQSRQTVRNYRDNGRLADHTVYDKNGVVISKDVYSYDTHDRMTESTSFGSKGQVVQKQSWSSDPNVILITRGNSIMRIVVKEKVKDQLDEYGNWQRSKQEKVINDSGNLSEVVEVTTRKFTYR